MKIVKVAAIAAASIIGLLVLAAVVIVYLFDPNDYKDTITDLVEERTGRRLTIADDLELSFFPWLAVDTGGLTLSNHAEFGPDPFATVDSVSARVRVLPLLRREIEIGTIVLDGLTLDLGRDANGVTNWSDLTGQSQPSDAEPAAAESGSGINRFALEGVRIRNGRILWRDGGPEVSYIVSDLELETSAIGDDNPVDVSASLAVLDVASQRTLTTETSGSVTLADSGTRVDNIAATLSVVDTQGTTRVTGDITLATLAINGSGAIETGPLAASAHLIDPPVGPGEVDARVDWQSARFDQSAGVAAIGGLVTRLGEIEARWSFDVSNLDSTPHVAGNVEVDPSPATALLELAAIELPADLDANTLGNLSGGGRFTVEMESRQVTLDGFVLALLGMELGVTGSGDIDGDLQAAVAIPEFRPSDALLSVARPYVPEGVNLETIETAAFTGNVARDAETLRVTDARLTLGPATLDATLTASGAHYRGRLNTSRMTPGFIGPLVGDLLTTEFGAREIGAVELSTTFDYDANADRLALSDIAAAAFGLSASGETTITNLSTDASATGRAQVDDFSLRAVLERFGQPVPQTSDPDVLARARISARFVVDGQQGEFSELAVALDDSNFRGSFSVRQFDNPSYAFDLSADRIDVDRYLPPPTEEAEDGERRAGDIALESEPLNALRLQGRAQVGDLKLANMQFQQVATNLTIGDGLAIIDQARANLYGGTFDGSFRVDTNEEQPTMRLTGRATTLDLNPLIVALTGSANISGTGNFDIDLTGAGPTVTDNLRSAAGRMNFSLTDGTLEGFNLGRTLCAAYNVTQQLPPPANQTNVTRFELIRADAEVSDGIATSPELLARSAFMDVTGGGRLLLADQHLDYNMRATLTNPIPIPGCEALSRFVGDYIPFEIEGPMTDVSIKPDFGQILRNRVREEIRERAEDSLRDRLRDLL